MQDEGSVASARALGRTARHAFWAIWWTSLLFKAWIATTLAPFGDEAFYWQESRALAWSYSDVPAATAVLIRLGESVCGHSEFGMRAMFLLLAALIPCGVLRIATRLFDARCGHLAGIAWMLLPLGATLGILALPDVPLVCTSLLALAALLRAAAENQWRDWLMLGLALALAWLCHYRAAMLFAAGAAFVLLTRSGHAQLRRPGLWAAVMLGLLGLLPLWVFNAQHAWAGLRFQLLERNPWAFHADALIQPVEQAIVTTPIIYLCILVALWACWRRRDQAAYWAVLATSGGSVVLAYFLFGLFADDLRFRLHWPLSGYMPALIALPALVERRQSPGLRRLWQAGLIVAGLGSLAALAYLALAASPTHTALLSRYKMFPENFVGWHEAGAVTEKQLDEWKGEKPLLVADNFLLAAELDFGLGLTPIYSLDSERNRKHGRALQLQLWSRDETALAVQQGAAVLLVVEETAGSERDRAAWQAQLCRHIEDLRRLQRLSLFEGRKRFAWYAGRVGTGDAGKPCAASLEDVDFKPAQ